MIAKKLAVLVACALMCQYAQAIPITGNITMAGSETLDFPSVNTSTTVLTWGPAFVTSVNGFPGVFVTQPVLLTAPWVFIPSGPHAALWNVGIYTFNLTSDTVTQGGGFLNIVGHGTISAVGFDTTDFNWNFSTRSEEHTSELQSP